MATQTLRRTQTRNSERAFVEPNAQQLSFFLAGRFKYFLHSFDTSGNYYVSSLSISQQLWERKNVDEVIEAMNERQVEFLPFYTKGNGSLKNYLAIGNNVMVASEDGIFYKIEYDNLKEEERLNFLYGFEEPEISILIEERDETPSTYQNYLEHDSISYDSLGSLGNITQESFTVSATTGSATELITDESQQISDTGGLSTAGRDREILNERVRVDTTDNPDAQPGTVRTSGY